MPNDVSISINSIFDSNLNKTIKQIHWIRHAESYSNTSELNYQIVDPSLTPRGILQCEELKDKLKSSGIYDLVELIVVSPLTRALETYSYTLGELGYLVKTICIEELREKIDLPCHKRKSIGQKSKNLKFKYVDFSQIKSNEDVLYDKFGGLEPKTHLIERTNNFVKWLKKRKEKNIIVITHGNFLYPLFNEVLELDKNINYKNTITKTFFSNCEIRTIGLVDE